MQAPRESRHNAWNRSTVAATAVLVVIVGLALWKWGIETRVVTQRSLELTGAERPSDIWFHDANLFGVEQTGSIVTIHKWPSDSAASSDRRVVDLARLVYTRPNSRIRLQNIKVPPSDSIKGAASATTASSRFQLASTQRAIASIIVPEEMPVAVSRDARQIAWVADQEDARLYVADLTPGKEIRDSMSARVSDTASLGKRGEIQLAFTDSGDLAIYNRTTGMLQLRTSAKNWYPMKFSTYQSMHVQRNWIVLVPPASALLSGETALIALDASSQRLAPRVYPIEGHAEYSSQARQQGDGPVNLPVAVSELGHIALGTPTGEIIHATADSISLHADDSVMVAPGAVRAMGFLDDRKLLVAGDFRGVHLLAPGPVDQEVASAPIGTSLLAVSPGRIAYAGGGIVTLAEVETTRVPTGSSLALAIGAVILGMTGIGVVKRSREVRQTPDQLVPINGSSPAVHYDPRPPPPPPIELIQALQRGECILIVGSGLGAQAGLPTWMGFLRGFGDYAAQQGELEEGSHSAVLEALASGNVMAASEILILDVETRAFREYVGEVYGKATVSPLHRSIGRLPFAGAVTTNFDTLLDKTFSGRTPVLATSAEGEGQGGMDLLTVVRGRKFFILNMLGRVDRPTTLIFTPRPYRDVLTKDLALRQLLRSLFEHYNVLFMGMGLAAVRDFLEAIEVTISPGETKHFALVGQPTPVEAAEITTLERNYRIRVLDFIPSPKWDQLKAFVDDALNQVGAGSMRPTEDRPRLSRLVLENIGPFESLDLTLSPEWNVVLGDNGVGKSIVLRAIAAALSAQEAPPDAVKRLLRTGHQSGKIEVYVGSSQSPHVVVLSRDLDGAVQLRSPGLSPLRLGNWLVVGFPALRAMTYVPTPKRGKPALPSASDLKALMLNEPDPRLSDLKAWLIDLKYRAITTTGSEADRAGKLFERFYQVLDAVTPGAAIAFDEIDHNNTIWITANGERVPLEAVSQGTASVLCWVGVLLQRMYDVHGGLEKPESGPVLVLVDEIDAHMHPGWQRHLVPALKELFPLLQVLATTHSPMIVGTMSEDQIFKASRVGNRVVIQQPNVKMAGLKADEVLTSPLFDLESSQVDPRIEAMLSEYTELVGRDPGGLAPEERKHLEELTKSLQKTPISPHDHFKGHQAFEVMASTVRKEIEHLSPDDRARVEAEIRVKMAEAASELGGAVTARQAGAATESKVGADK